MFSTCLFCHSPLGRNAIVEAFPVGRRLAFDAVRGRLWVVCRGCAGWNLSPLEERWEAVEQCERLYRGTTVRISTDHIGLATLGDGVDLVRVGKPLRPEFAAWRYGSRLLRPQARRVRAVAADALRHGASLALGGASALVGVALTASGSHTLHDSFRESIDALESSLAYDRVLARVRMPDGHIRALRFGHVARLEILDGGAHAPWSLRVAHEHGSSEFTGADAVQTASRLLSRLNQRTASRSQVQDATRRIASAGDAEGYIRQSSRVREYRRRRNSIFWNDDIGILGLTSTERLALEIAVHEDAERSAMLGELDALTTAWRDAETIAAIADRMFLPDQP